MFDCFPREGRKLKGRILKGAEIEARRNLMEYGNAISYFVIFHVFDKGLFYVLCFHLLHNEDNIMVLRTLGFSLTFSGFPVKFL